MAARSASSSTPRSATRSSSRNGGRGVGRLGDAVDLLDSLVLSDDFAEFLTLGAYRLLDEP